MRENRLKGGRLLVIRLESARTSVPGLMSVVTLPGDLSVNVGNVTVVVVPPGGLYVVWTFQHGCMTASTCIKDSNTLIAPHPLSLPLPFSTLHKRV